MIEEYECDPKDIICCICPCIKQCHFEVDEDVKDLFKQEFGYMDEIIKNIYKEKIIQTQKGKRLKYYIDTTLINKLTLQEVGLKGENIIDSGICTVCNSNKFHSYRTDKEKSGRNAAMISIKQREE